MTVDLCVFVCVCVWEPFSPFLVFILFFMSFFFYGAFSICVSYLCICRLNFKAKVLTLNAWMYSLLRYYRLKPMYILVTYIYTLLCIITTSERIAKKALFNIIDLTLRRNIYVASQAMKTYRIEFCIKTDRIARSNIIFTVEAFWLDDLK